MDNQAVVFTKPVHHLDSAPSPEALDALVCQFLAAHRFNLLFTREVSGSELVERQVIRRHYRMYSEGSYDPLPLIDSQGRARFEATYGRRWDDEIAAGRILGNLALMKTRDISASELFAFWNARFVRRETVRLQAGLVAAWIDALDGFAFNAFYPVLEQLFNDPATRMFYYVVAFDPAQIDWHTFRKAILGATDASRAAPESLRGQLFAQYPVAFPGRDNYVHGSAGPVEGLVERMIHEPDFRMESNPLGERLLARGIDRDRLSAGFAAQPLARVVALFDATEELNAPPAFDRLTAWIDGCIGAGHLAS